MRTYLIYKHKIKGYKDVDQTVKAVEKIAASHIHFLKGSVAEMNKYSQMVESIISRLQKFDIKIKNELLNQRQKGQKALIVVSGNKGLAGGIWHNIVNFTLEKKDSYDDLFVIGRKGANYLKEEGWQAEKVFDQFSEIPKRQEILNVSSFIFHYFKNNQIKKIDIIYPEFQSVTLQQSKLVSFLPFEFNNDDINSHEDKKQEEDLGFPIFEAAQILTFNWFLQKYIEMFFYKIIIETKLSEFSARTVAMENADSKTSQLIQKLELDLNKERRRASTQKQLESFMVHKII